MLREVFQIGERTREFLIHPSQCPSLTVHRIQLAGISRATTGFRFARHRPNMQQLLVCFRGQGRVWIDGGWKKSRAGDAYLTPAHAFHAYEAGPRWEVGWIIYAPDPRAARTETPRLIETDPQPFEYVLQGLHHEVSTQREATLLEYWSRLLHRHAERIIAPDHSSRLWRVWRTVQADLGTEWNLAKLARLAGLGPENLRRICLLETGRSPMQHLTHLRMAYAISLLTTGRKIEEVANLTGYTNAFAFSTAFKRAMGKPPSRFRN